MKKLNAFQKMQIPKNLDEYDGPMITACSECLQASCWQGILMCWDSTNAGTIELPRGYLKKLNLENECYWR